ncbi:transporter substrate-binding domain-containing protein [Comamonadaceae bacterium G21597-S1]|nr:transporter substrate-binding domain-containing protein [Comamonadaceae bacterium G21597-S1]
MTSMSLLLHSIKRCLGMLRRHAVAGGVIAMATSVTITHAQEASSRLDEIVKRGTIVVGVTSESPPFGSIDEKGNLVGFEIDLAKLVAKALFKDESKVELVRQSFSARFPNVQSGKIDIGIQVTTVYPERLLSVAFTRPYIDSGTAVLVRKDSPIKTINDLNDARYKAGLVSNPQQQERHQRYYPKAQPVTFDGYTPLMLALQSKRVDIVQADLPVARWYAAQNQELRVLSDLLSDRTYNAIFMKQGDFRLWLVMDQIVAAMRGGALYTDYAAIHEKWFGSRPDRVSP